MTVKLATRAIFITAGLYVAAIAAFTLMGATREVALFFGGSTALMALAALMLARGVLESISESGVKEGGFFRLISDPFLILTPGSMGPGPKAFIAAGILYFTKVFVFGDVALGLPPLWFVLFGGG